jgi:hypothetical protein
MSPAEFCRTNGFSVGDSIEGRDDFMRARFVITAIGESLVLAKQTVSQSFGFSETKGRGSEQLWFPSGVAWEKIEGTEGSEKTS